MNVYKKALFYKKTINTILRDNKTDKDIKDQFKRAATSIVLNLAEGFGRFYSRDKKRFYITARGSVNECVACADIIYDSNIPDSFLKDSEEIAKMLTGLINRYNK